MIRQQEIIELQRQNQILMEQMEMQGQALERLELQIQSIQNPAQELPPIIPVQTCKTCQEPIEIKQMIADFKAKKQ